MNRTQSIAILMSFIFLNLGHAQDVETAGSRIVSIKEKTDSENANGIDQLQKLTEIDPIKGHIETCRATKSQNGEDTSNKAILDCAWKELDDSDKEKVYALLNSNTEDDERGSQYDVGLANFKNEKSSATKVLEKYLLGKLEEALYGDQPGNLKIANDHTSFYELYRSQLGKNLISQLSAFCIYTDDEGNIPFGSKERLAENKKKNLDGLNQIDPTSGISTSFKGYSSCIQRVSIFCEEGKNFTDQLKDPVPPPCELNRLMTSAKIAISKTEDLIETFGELDAQKGLTAGLNKEALNIQKITNVGSKELIKDSGYEKEQERIAQEIESNCIDVADAESNPTCAKYLTKKSENDELSLEFALRNKALTEKVKDHLDQNLNEETLKSVLNEQGLTDEEYEQLKVKVQSEIDSGQNKNDCATIEECIRNKIVDRYEHEREQLAMSLQKRLEQTQYDDTEGTQTAAKALENVKSTYENSAESLAEVYQYSNIVSSFIDIESNGKLKKNTAALAAELESNYFSADSNDGRNTASSNQDGTSSQTVRDLESLSDLAKGSDSDDGTDAVTLDSGQINKLQQWLPDNKAEGEEP
ncbi:MAG: hypothetical protein CME63_00065 [Halobacteriovoraceae bacterium]|nr:hypothetical protein [Halobacteriovoraceae bacterium]|tara:strand:- start:54847 stop:56604 length:1758 start_codon:yes stop_codon:yes gene_type:complete